jgi:hypothetical protein
VTCITGINTAAAKKIRLEAGEDKSTQQQSCQLTKQTRLEAPPDELGTQPQLAAASSSHEQHPHSQLMAFTPQQQQQQQYSPELEQQQQQQQQGPGSMPGTPSASVSQDSDLTHGQQWWLPQPRPSLDEAHQEWRPAVPLVEALQCRLCSDLLKEAITTAECGHSCRAWSASQQHKSIAAAAK